MKSIREICKESHQLEMSEALGGANIITTLLFFWGKYWMGTTLQQNLENGFDADSPFPSLVPPCTLGVPSPSSIVWPDQNLPLSLHNVTFFWCFILNFFFHFHPLFVSIILYIIDIFQTNKKLYLHIITRKTIRFICHLSTVPKFLKWAIT